MNRALNTCSFLSPGSLVGWSCRVHCSDLSPVVGPQAGLASSPSLYRWEGSSFSPLVKHDVCTWSPSGRI